MIKRVKEDDIDFALKLITDCRIDLDNRNIPQWVPEYPNKESLQDDIRKGELYGYYNPHLSGIIVFHNRQDPEYKQIDWLYDEPVITIRRLAVSIDQHRQGIAAKLMDYSENYALENNAKSIRLDVFTLNKVAIRFYEKRDYILRGLTFFKYRGYPFYCYEKEIIHKKRIV